MNAGWVNARVSGDIVLRAIAASTPAAFFCVSRLLTGASLSSSAFATGRDERFVCCVFCLEC